MNEQVAEQVTVESMTRRSGPGRRRVFSPVVDQHATWIAVNPIQGCPKACTYCFLNDRGQTAVRPKTVASPGDAVDLLLASRYYAPTRPVAFYTWTDVMALPTSRAHLLDVLDVLVDRKVPNPLVLITKCHVPDEVIDAIRRARDVGVTALVYLSYSGLDRDIERGIRRDAVAANFPRLAAAGIPIVHYWRPAFPASATEETMTEVFDHASAHARCTVAAGLKAESAALDRLAQVWPELAQTPGVTEAECVSAGVLAVHPPHLAAPRRLPGVSHQRLRSVLHAYPAGRLWRVRQHRVPAAQRLPDRATRPVHPRRRCPDTTHRRRRPCGVGVLGAPGRGLHPPRGAGAGDRGGRGNAHRGRVDPGPGRAGPRRPRVRRPVLEQRHRRRNTGDPAMSTIPVSPLGGHLDELLAETRMLRHRFAPTAARPWDAATAAAELCVQAGHLAQCLLRRSGRGSPVDDPRRPIARVGDELADVLLATCSVTVLAGTTPATPATAAHARETTEAFLHLLAAAGALAEAALVAAQYRHPPTGNPSTVAEAAGVVLATCESLAQMLELDLLAEFRAMVADADTFLNTWGEVRWPSWGSSARTLATARRCPSG